MDRGTGKRPGCMTWWECLDITKVHSCVCPCPQSSPPHLIAFGDVAILLKMTLCLSLLRMTIPVLIQPPLCFTRCNLSSYLNSNGTDNHSLWTVKRYPVCFLSIWQLWTHQPIQYYPYLYIFLSTTKQLCDCTNILSWSLETEFYTTI